MNIGDIPPGKTVVVTFSVQVENPLKPANTTQISNQGTVKGTNFADVLTDDPTVGGATDPTVTQLCTNPSVVTTNADSGAGSLRQALRCLRRRHDQLRCGFEWTNDQTS